MQLASTVDVTPFNKLTLLSKIGHGGFGDVFLARHHDWSEVAYKRLVVNFIKPDERLMIISVSKFHIHSSGMWSSPSEFLNCVCEQFV